MKTDFEKINDIKSQLDRWRKRRDLIKDKIKKLEEDEMSDDADIDMEDIFEIERLDATKESIEDTIGILENIIDGN